MWPPTMHILTDFVEGEKPATIIDWNSDALHRKAWNEIKSLYRWWKKERPRRHSPLDNPRLRMPPFTLERVPGSKLMKRVDVDQKKYSAYYRALKVDSRLEQKWGREDQENLHRLIDIRRYLWT